MHDCALCGAMNGDLASTAHWRIVLNENQDRLGKCFLVLDRHEEDVCNLAPEERSDLWVAMRLVRDTLAACFQPNHFNYQFLMNHDAHAHLHVVPRYQTPRTFAGIEFPVLNSLDGAVYRPPAPVFEQIVATIRPRLALRSTAQTQLS